MRTGIQGRGKGNRLVRYWNSYEHSYPEHHDDLKFWAQFLTPDEAASALGVSRAVIDQHINQAIEG